MSESDELIPPPPVVREKLAASLRQTNLLRRLLRLSVRAAADRQRLISPTDDRHPDLAVIDAARSVEPRDDSDREGVA